MRKDDGSRQEWCKHSRNSQQGKAGHNRSVRMRVRQRIRMGREDIAGRFTSYTT